MKQRQLSVSGYNEIAARAIVFSLDSSQCLIVMDEGEYANLSAGDEPSSGPVINQAQLIIKDYDIELLLASGLATRAELDAANSAQEVDRAARRDDWDRREYARLKAKFTRNDGN